MSELKWTEGCDALVDFVEEHGGSMGGETRDHLFNIVQNIIDGQLSRAPTGLTRERLFEILTTMVYPKWKIETNLDGSRLSGQQKASRNLVAKDLIAAILESSSAPKEPDNESR